MCTLIHKIRCPICVDQLGTTIGRMNEDEWACVWAAKQKQRAVNAIKARHKSFQSELDAKVWLTEIQAKKQM